MPKITIEKLVRIAEDIYEVKEKTYVIPDKVIINDTILYYDNYHKAYISRSDDIWITASDYLNKKLNNKDNKILNDLEK